VAADESGVYVVGITQGSLPGHAGSGTDEAFVVKYDPQGNVLWTRQFGNGNGVGLHGVAVDATGVYVVGGSCGSRLGEPLTGESFGLVRKYARDGREIWTRQFLSGTSACLAAEGVAADASGVYVVANEELIPPGEVSRDDVDVTVRKYDPDGDELWVRTLRTPEQDLGSGIATDGATLYVVGTTRGTLPGQPRWRGYDAFAAAFDPNGVELWTRQFGTEHEDMGFAVAADASGVYVAINTNGEFPAQTTQGDWDAVLRKYDASGTDLWTTQFGTASAEYLTALSAADGGLFVYGYTSGALPGQVSAGNYDPFLRRYDANGGETWTHQFGTGSMEEGRGLAVSASAVYAGGATYGTLPGEVSSGGSDAFLVKIVEFMTPASRDDCKDGGWERLRRADGAPFRNQGDCVSYVNIGR
jgi:uncharacterized protein (UPF0548 family)